MSKNVDLSKYTINQDSFKFVNSDKRISDTQLKTKPVSFSKDAFRRFCKNKSSIAGAIVLGIIILMAIFVPIFSPYSTDRVSADEAFLAPKLFKAGTGFWDGTESYHKRTVLYDFEEESPAGFYKPAVLNLKVDTEPTYINYLSNYGLGGYVRFENETVAGSEAAKNALLNNYYSFIAKDSGNYTVAISLLEEEGVLDRKLGEYRVFFGDDTAKIVLKDWSKDYGDFTFDLSKALHDNGIAELDGKLYFELKPTENVNSYVLIKNCIISCDDADANAALSEISFSDASKMVKRAKDSGGTFPAGYWSCSGIKGVYRSEVYYCTFDYDTYEKVYGEREASYTISELNKFKSKGLCSFDEADIKGTFKKLSDECEIEEISAVVNNELTGKVKSVKALVPYYYKLGYKKMPTFLLGTDVSGIDLFTRMFTGLRTSLVLGVCTAAFCFLFGLIWGSISGYFGGVIDLVMERFCDILGGVPWLVIMTLAILHFGNNFLTFFMALCLTGWMGTAARTRTQFYRFKGGEYVLAARTLGSSDLRLIFKHILPNSLGTIVTSSVLMITSTIYSESTLAYLNLGLQGVQAFGVLLSNNQKYIDTHSYLVIHPAIIMALLMISFNLFGNGLRDALNPQLRGAED